MIPSGIGCKLQTQITTQDALCSIAAAAAAKRSIPNDMNYSYYSLHAYWFGLCEKTKRFTTIQPGTSDVIQELIKKTVTISFQISPPIV
uniref:Uncharacterized protein n=1 Tax=Strigamia maritima TaxID=126957 RepID=T1IM17_STRMM